jgi:uncharacterized membrane-anchored protein YhcB (DUF1043 family)
MDDLEMAFWLGIIFGVMFGIAIGAIAVVW